MFDVCMGPVGESLLKKEYVHILLSMASPLGPWRSWVALGWTGE